MTREREVEAVEQWFRRRGLPAVVRGRPARLLVRTAPATVFLATTELMGTLLSWVDGRTDSDFDRLMQNQLFAWGYIALLLATVVLPCLGCWLAARWVRRRMLERGGAVLSGSVAGAFVIVVPVADWAVSGGALVLDIVVHLVLLALVLGAAFVGIGSITGWALRAAVRQTRLLGELTSRALPLLLVFTVLGYFTADIWQVFSSLNAGRVWLVVGLFTAVAVVFLLAIFQDEVATLAGSQATPVDWDRLRETPLASFDPAGGQVARVPLRKLERANTVLVLVLTQVLQTLVLAALAFVFFVVLGAVSVRDAVIKSWIGRAPTSGAVFGVQVPVAHEILRVSLFFAAFTGLYFVASTVTDTKYRSAFLDPLTDHLAVSLVARDLYLARISGASPAKPFTREPDRTGAPVAGGAARRSRDSSPRPGAAAAGRSSESG